MTSSVLKHEFVEFIPDQLMEGTVYISIPYATVVHKCCCGCGSEVVTPLGATDWQLVFDGESISLMPSIGNWSLPCQSHYWIRRNRVKWAPKWTLAQIEATRAADRAAKQEYFAGSRDIAQTAPAASRRNIWSRIKGWFY